MTSRSTKRYACNAYFYAALEFSYWVAVYWKFISEKVRVVTGEISGTLVLKRLKGPVFCERLKINFSLPSGTFYSVLSS